METEIICKVLYGFYKPFNYITVQNVWICRVRQLLLFNHESCLKKYSFSSFVSELFISVSYYTAKYDDNHLIIFIYERLSKTNDVNSNVQIRGIAIMINGTSIKSNNSKPGAVFGIVPHRPHDFLHPLTDSGLSRQ